jgi:uncharacterized protein
METDGRRSSNVEDRRGRGGGRTVAVGGLGTLVLVVVGLFFGVDPEVMLQLSQGAGEQLPTQGGAPPADDPAAGFASVVLASTEDVWNARFHQMGKAYPEPVLVLFRDAVQSGCGSADAQVGPFYCPADRKLYIDLEFLGLLTKKLGAEGDFAQAYVIAHEVGHHVQNVMGFMRGAPADNEASVSIELQADCFAGVWAHDADKVAGVVEPGDLEEAMNAAQSVGDDRLQQMAGQAVSPESFTHGSAADRMAAFNRGYKTGDVAACGS